MQFDAPQCIECKWFDMATWLCETFGHQIPDAILMGEHNHRQPHEGDGGIRFEPIDDREQNAT